MKGIPFSVKMIRSLLGMNTLRGQLYFILIISAIIPFLLVSSESVYSIYSILDNKIHKGVESNLHQVRLALDNTLDNLYVDSQQFLFNGIIGQDLQKLMNSSDTYETAVLTSSITHNMNVFNASNPIIGLTFYYVPNTQKIMFQNLITRNEKLEELPVLARRSNDIIFNIPHQTLYKFNDSTVFSLIRKVNSIENNVPNDVYVYIETNAISFQRTVNTEQYGMRAFHLLLDREGRIAYSGNPELFKVGELYTAKEEQHYIAFTEQSDLGWKVAVYINKDDYNAEFKKWSVRSIGLGVVSLIISILLALQIWYVVFKPLVKIRKGMTAVIDNKLDEEELSLIGLKEFDFMIEHFNLMRQEIKRLIEEVKDEAKNRQEVEVEKLMAQINPHFLYNTLNTAQWLAKINGQHEIDRFLTLFTRVLKYNLAKAGIMVTLKDEIQALHEYIELQQIRYDYQFQVNVNVDDQALDVILPRFLLQPIVENALYHGMSDSHGFIKVDARIVGNELLIIVEDNGVGMTLEKVQSLLAADNPKNDKVGLGIGLHYVAKTMKSYFGESSRLEIQSTLGKGTSITVTIPVRRKDDSDD